MLWSKRIESLDEKGHTLKSMLEIVWLSKVFAFNLTNIILGGTIEMVNSFVDAYIQLTMNSILIAKPILQIHVSIGVHLKRDIIIGGKSNHSFARMLGQ